VSTNAGILATVLAAVAVSLLGCTAAPNSADNPPTSAPASPPPVSGPPVTQAPRPTDTVPAATNVLATDIPAVAEPTAQPSAVAPTTEASVRGTWLGTIESNGSSQGIRFLLRDIGGVISGTALWDSGKIDNGLRGSFEGDVLTLDDSIVGGINVYEGTISGDVFAGEHTTVPRLQGQEPSTFEATREE